MQLRLYGVGALWACALVMWPRQANRLTLLDNAQQTQAAGEGLYKSSLTQANFGMLGFHLYDTNENKKHWNIRSKFAELHRKENYAFMQEVIAEFFAKTGNVVETRSKFGRSMLDKEIVELEEDVSIQSHKGYLFNVTQLTYDGKSHEFHSDSIINMKGPNIDRPILLLKGTGLNADIDREHFIVKKNVTAQKKLKNSQWLKVTARHGEFFTDEQRAVFRSDVRTIMPNLNMTSDYFEMLISEEEESIFARGNVRMLSKKRRGSAETAILQTSNNRIILEGKARIESKDNEIEGKRIILHTDDDRVEVVQAEGSVN
ncbi:MAG: LPS export ABC transporter periplasmic protein LptC [Deltaproteobacteria bacterium]|nr:LPS export ABC transporter periplasmic protein LptC [Deltaproteobacteria bacterium]